MKLDSRVKSILLALLGIAFSVAYFWLFSHTKVSSLLRFEAPPRDVLMKAREAYERSALSEYNLDRRIRVNVDKDVSHYAQMYLETDQLERALTAAEWAISWRGEVENQEGKKEDVRFAVSYDLNGKLIGFEKILPPNENQVNLSESEALQKARITLADNAVDTSAIELDQKTISEKSGVSNYQFSYSRPVAFSAELRQKYDVNILGSEVTKFATDLELDEKQFKFPNIVDVSETVGGVAAFIVWMIVSIFLLVVFVKRIRHDEIEFKRAIWMGGGVGAVTWAMVAVETSGWQGILLGGGFSGLFSGIGMLIAFSAAESLGRDIWPEKLKVTDLLFRGHFRVKELGMTILDAFFIVGLLLVIQGSLLWLVSTFNIGYHEIENDDFWVFQGLRSSVAAVCQNLIGASFVAVVPIFFWATYLKSKIERSVLFIAGLGFSILLAGFHFFFLRPTYLAFIVSVPIVVLAAYFVHKYGLFTILVSVFGFFYLSDLSVISLSPESFLGPIGAVTSVIAVGLLATAVALVYSKTSVQDFALYVPEYVSRIAERERLLKELEIARTVQMKFLPQSIPDFPKLDIACVCRPAMEVGGDYYDFIARDDTYLNVLVGDVSGKGVSAAFYMTMTAGIFRTLSKRVASPKELLTELNEVFYEYTPREVFISAIYGRFDMESKTLTFARAGHNPVMGWKSVGAQTEILDSKGIAIGLEGGQLFSASIEEKRISIETGDLFVFYTDGLSEAMNHKADEFGEERLEELITKNAHIGAQAFLDNVTNEVSQFVGEAKQHDDLTMVVVKVK